MSGHTPGPWTREGEFIYGPDGLPVASFCTAERSTDQDIINATLGQAAPELLEACRAALPLLKAMYAVVPVSFGEGPVNALVEAAIAKAEGRS